MNMYLHELKSLRKSTIVWTIVIIALAALYLSVYPGMVKDAEGFKKLLGNYPAPVRAMLGINLNYITSIVGFYSMIFSFITLCGAIQSMNLGVSILSKESRERTADFLLVKPVSRPAIVTAKLLASLTMILALDIVFYAALSIMVHFINTGSFDEKIFFLINLTLLFLQFMFFAIGLVISVLFSKLKSVLPISLGVVLGFYMIGALISTGKNDDAARYLSPFNYFNVTNIIKNANYEASYLITGAVIVIAPIVASYIIYSRKDIHAVS
ncbi:ABC transporter permease subunit [Sporolactobacillus pectinivorans]|uniref:ABC transporter permease subunit n=1 Tax=Sporolactobacillus pectinivorans TaxID=1591408 RepID=UPI000C25A878|nr:ABC transporter permease subunit [Sporolactobacillus pectinivorans]